MKQSFKGSINNKAINAMSLKQLRLINDILDGKLTEAQKVKRVKALFPETITGSGEPI